MPGERAISTSDGRTLAVCEGGDPDGFPVLVHHGTPGSALLYEPAETLARAQGVRLIGYDRPGYGGSGRARGRSVADCVDDVHAIADALQLDRFATWGMSGGGPHALACAVRCDARLTAVALLGSVAPYDADGLDWFAGMGDENVDEFGAALEGEDALRAYLEPAGEAFLQASPEQVVELLSTLVGPADRAVLGSGVAEWMVEGSQRGLRDGVDGWLDDDLAFARPWGFDPGDADRPVLLLHGGDDRFVPAAHARCLAARIPGVETRIDPDDGHLTLLERRVGETHEWLLERA